MCSTSSLFFFYSMDKLLSPSSYSTPRASQTAKYAVLLRKLESSCRTCGISYHTSPSPSASASASRGPSAAPSEQPRSPYDSASIASSGPYDPRWSCTAATASVPRPVSSLFEVHLRRCRHRHKRAEMLQGNLYSTAASREAPCCSFTSPSPHAVRQPRPHSQQDMRDEAAKNQKSASPTADIYYDRYLARYRSQHLRAPQTVRKEFPCGAVSKGSTTALARSAEAHTAHNPYARGGIAEPQQATRPLRHIYSPSLSTPGCSPILTTREICGAAGEERVYGSPVIVCRLFTSACSEDEAK